ncbi:3-methyl-2-oxobutanoate hydroxymethyltransferase [Desulfoprunum benzoelyticum]|uniref:3-methyl-2-oxobutanoate hydroxymethyltransferase n=1 Tax=Desulfoprunum benzoelyticum TaxID=1506996 RepID=A0A840UY84_9BACT|nr:3-methyl-2-oxobutanoate hydroxymethyltransferase [Desulfoprunum benzoelyticum]MBB5347618.1 3-methyl-2-oxobutanoate hydroxymethyltransferase [Desulfoprunum benzoelyticum]MBM9529253.1 3-methyl-2-oxobutanoate hydroxymethyltransferase [Desulfoprunum benzoelyticum]
MRKTIRDIRAMKAGGSKITVLTAYDAAMASLFASCEVDILLVGDSLGMVMLGYDSTVPVTMADMIHHAAAVRRGAPDAFVICDMPFGSYHTGVRDAVINGLRIMKEAGSDAVKLEGGLEMCVVVKGLVEAGVPVMGHIGLTPQTASQLGGYKVQGKDLEAARRLVAEAKALEEAGAFALTIECVPAGLAEIITSSLAIPTIGIGAGVHCDGQVLVGQDMLGMFEKFQPKFVKQYASLAPQIKAAVEEYNSEVRNGSYPGAEHSFADSLDYRQLLAE